MATLGVLYVIPFPFALFIAMKQLNNRHIDSTLFIIFCLCPGPALCYTLVRAIFKCHLNAPPKTYWNWHCQITSKCTSWALQKRKWKHDGVLGGNGIFSEVIDHSNEIGWTCICKDDVPYCFVGVFPCSTHLFFSIWG